MRDCIITAELRDVTTKSSSTSNKAPVYSDDQVNRGDIDYIYSRHKNRLLNFINIYTSIDPHLTVFSIREHENIGPPCGVSFYLYPEN